MAAIALAIALLLFICIGWSCWGRIRGLRVLLSLPGPPPNLPFRFGNTRPFFKTGGSTSEITKVLIKEYYEVYGSPCLIWQGPFLSVHLFKPKHVETILKGAANIRKSLEYDFLRDWLGNGLLTNNNWGIWSKRRKQLTPAFHFAILRDVLPSMNAGALIFARRLAQGAPMVDVCPLLKQATLDLICETAMGVSLGAQEERNTDYVTATADFAAGVVHRLFRPWLFPATLYYGLSDAGREQRRSINVLHAFSDRVIQQRLEERKNSGRICGKNMSNGKTSTVTGEVNGKLEERTSGKKAFLDLLLDLADEGELNLDQRDVDGEQGHDTTAMALAWTFYLLGSSGEVESEHLGSLRYVECCIRESLRIYPSVPIIMRKLDTPVRIKDEHVDVELPPGTWVHVPVLQLHRDPEQFPDPERFQPERFEDKAAHRHPFAYIPFSAGPRNCIGQRFAMMEAKTLLAQALLHVEWTSAEQDPGKMKPAMQMILRPCIGIQLHVKPLTRS